MASRKAVVTLAGVPLAALGSIVWRLQTGVVPYQTTLQVHRTQWPKLEKQMAKPLVLDITDAEGTKVTIREVYILHELPTDSVNRVTFLVSDRRWKWPRVFVSRDYNIPKRTGDRTILDEFVPAGGETIIDRYDFKPFSLKGGETKWTPKEAVEDVLRVITEDETNKWAVISFPIEDEKAGAEDGQFSLQNIVLRDSGDVALGRMLAAVPGAAVYITVLGQIHVIDAADLKAGEKHLETLKFQTWAGQVPKKIDRKAIRPARVHVHYQREVELLCECDCTFETSTLDRTAAFVQNVIPTVDPETTMDVYNPETGEDDTVKVAAGTYVEISSWLKAMDALKPSGSWPWTFEIVKRHMFLGRLENHWGGSDARGVVDDVPTGNVMSRIQAFKAHFRQTFRINPRYMDRIRSIQEVRVSPRDPITGARAPAGVWSQATVHENWKGQRIHQRRNAGKSGEWVLIDNTPTGDEDVTQKPPSAARLTFLDRDQGVFRVGWMLSPFGTDISVFPGHVTNITGSNAVPRSQLRDQDDGEAIMGPRMRREALTNELFLANTLTMKAIVTIVPGAPNNKQQFHVETVEASDVKELFREEFGIAGGTGPDMELFISPGEATVRHAWGTNRPGEDDDQARFTMKQLLGINFEDPIHAGLPRGTKEMAGFTWLNTQREIPPHANAVAAEALASFADNMQGRVATRVPKETMRITGNISAAEVRIAADPHAKVDAMHTFPGQQLPISRFALLPDSSRKLILGIVDGVMPDE